jgi:hypothetical protein
VTCTVPVGALVDGSSGAFSWTPTALEGPGTYRFHVAVTDGVATTVEEITVTVNDTVVVTPQLVFTTPAEPLTLNVTSDVMTIQRRNGSGTPQNAGNLVVNLSTTGGGLFRNAANSATITTVTIPNGSSTASFRYRGTALGTPTLTASRSGYTAATQVQSVQRPVMVFTSPPRTTTTGVSSAPIVIERRLANGDPRSGGALTVQLTTSGPGVFRNNADTQNITSVTIPEGSSTVRFRYRANQPGTPTMTAAASGYTAGTQGVTIIGLPKLVFTTPARTTPPGVSSAPITIERQSFGGAALTDGALVVNLSRTGSGVFRNATDTAIITSVTIPDGASTASFRFRANGVGRRDLTVAGSGHLGATQRITIDTAPTISGLSSAYTMRRNTTRTLNFTVGDADTGAGSVQVTATSSNTNLVAASGITFPDTSGATRQIRIAPRSGRTGTTTITVRASDGLVTTTTTFTLTVTT